MLCPKCHNTPLKSGTITAKQLLLDQCTQCEGLWFDKGELEILLGANAETDFDIPKSAANAPGTECPRCKISLYEFCYPGTLTLVDSCKQCSGVWLDNKEWKAINHARDESNKINCPKCNARQNPTDSCIKCGIIIAKFNSTDTDIRTDTRIANCTAEQSYADGIPGVKGSLLRMIDSTIKNLGGSIF